MPSPAAWPALVGRRDDVAALRDLVAAVRAGTGSALVLRGAPGIGRTVLLDVAVELAADCRVTRAAGVEAETELPFAGLHQLCRPFLDRLAGLPAPQRDALEVAFGRTAGPAPTPFLAGLAVLGLLAGLAGGRPVLAVVDDAQWLDRESVQALGFAARRVHGLPLGLLVTTRDDGPGFPGVPERTVGGLPDTDAADLLGRLLVGPLDARVRDRVLAECRGTPSALLATARDLLPVELDRGPADRPPRDLDPSVAERLRPLPTAARRLLLLAAAEPLGDVPLLWRAAGRLGLGPDAVAAAEATGLVEVRDRVLFRHPLVRPAVWCSATPPERRLVHGALAAATDGGVDPDRRAWHRAAAAAGPDEAVAGELVRAAGRARDHGGLGAAAALVDRAAVLTPEPARRAHRALAAADGALAAGATDRAATLLALARVGPLDAAGRARLALLAARQRLAEHPGRTAVTRLVAAATESGADPARDALLDAFAAALSAGGPAAAELTTAAHAAPSSGGRPREDLLAALSVRCTDGLAASVGPSRRAVAALTGATTDDVLRAGWLAAATAASLWDEDGWDQLTARHLQLCRASGALGALPAALTARTLRLVVAGDLAAAGVLVREARWTAEVTGSRPPGDGAAAVAALCGREQEAEPLVRSLLADAADRDGAGAPWAHWACAVLSNGRGHYREALPAAQQAAADPVRLGPASWALAEVVEAAVRSGAPAAAAAALEQLTALADAAGTDWALGVAASRRALLATGVAADDLHREAVERLGRTGIRVELARAQLLHGEWLRRQGRRVAARTQLRAAHQAFDAMGAEAFADRARHELLATGETVRKRTVAAGAALTAQEAHIARLAAQGLTNPEIGAVLYVSPRTVEWHLRKTFAKLGVRTRRELRRSLPAVGSAAR